MGHMWLFFPSKYNDFLISLFLKKPLYNSKRFSFVPLHSEDKKN